VLRSLAQSYDDEGRGFELRNVAGGWRLFTREEYADVVERFAQLLPEVILTLGAEEFARLAAAALEAKPEPAVQLTHLHAPRVSVREQAELVSGRLRQLRVATFRTLVADAPDTLTVVARFLALLDLFHAGVVSFDQVSPLGELHVRWNGPDQAPGRDSDQEVA